MLDFPNPLSRDSLLVFSAENRHIKIAALFFFSFPFRLLLRSLLLFAFRFLLWPVILLPSFLAHSLTHSHQPNRKEEEEEEG